MLTIIAKLLKILNSETRPSQISLGFCFAMVAGFTPLLSLHNVIVLLLILLIRVNLSAFILGLGFFSGLAFALDPIFHKFGLLLLTASPLEGLWTTLYNIPLFRLANFNNSILMGSLVISLLLFDVLLILLNVLITKYRENVLEWIQKTKIGHIVKGSKLFSIYQSVAGGN